MSDQAIYLHNTWHILYEQLISEFKKIIQSFKYTNCLNCFFNFLFEIQRILTDKGNILRKKYVLLKFYLQSFFPFQQTILIFHFWKKFMFICIATENILIIASVQHRKPVSFVLTYAQLTSIMISLIYKFKQNKDVSIIPQKLKYVSNTIAEMYVA